MGKLDFTDCDKSSSAVTKKLEDLEKMNLKPKSPQKTQEERTSKNQSSETSEGEEGRTSGLNEDSSNGDRRTCSVGAVTAASSIGGGGGSGEGGMELLVAERGFLESKLKEEEERLRKLRMVKLYRTKVTAALHPLLQ